MVNLKLHTCLALFAMTSHAGVAIARTYTVQQGDTLTAIAGKEIGRPVYGSKGSLKTLKSRNPEIKNIDRIYPKQIIRISDDPQETPVAAPAPTPAPVQEKPVVAESAAPAPAAEPAAPESASFGVNVAAVLSKDHLDVSSLDHSYKTNLDSRLNKGLELQAYYKPTSDLQVGAEVGFNKTTYNESRDDRFEGASKNLKKLALFGEMTLANRWHLGLELGTEQAYFFNQTDLATFELDAIFVDFARASAGFDFIATNDWRLGLTLTSAYHGKADHGSLEVHKGSSYGANAILAYRWIESSSLEAELFYQRRNQGTDLTSQKTSSTGATVGIRYEF